jgi:hypothetical protein
MPRTMSRFALSLFAAALLSVTLASCGSDLLQGLDQSWTLTTVRDSTLPYTVPHSSNGRVINSAEANLSSDNTYTITFTGTVSGAAGQVGADHGTWSVSSSVFTFHSSTSVDYIAALVGSTFRASVPGQFVGSSEANFDMLFTKQ